MYAPLYNRLCGWLFFALGMIGLTTGRLGDYMKFHLPESIACVTIGVLGMLAARASRRGSVLACLLLGVLLLTYGMLGFFRPMWLPGGAEPLDNALRVVAGIWGIYTGVADVRRWIQAE